MSNTLPKYDYNLGCLSYGSNLLIKVDNVDVLRAQFERFEKHFRNNENVFYDLKLPLFIIDAFTKLWKLWIDFPEKLQEGIDRSEFHKIFVDLSSFFQTDRDCDEKHRQVVLKTADKIPEHTIESVDVGTPPLQCAKSNGLSPPDKTEPEYINQPLTTADCWEVRRLDSGNSTTKMSNSNSSKTSSSSSLFLSPEKNGHLPTKKIKSTDVPIDLLFKLPTKEDQFCGPCCRNVFVGLSVDENTILEHLESTKHCKSVNMMKESVYYLEQNKPWIILTCPRTFAFRCIACTISQTGANCLNQHCKSTNHLKKVLPAAGLQLLPAWDRLTNTVR